MFKSVPFTKKLGSNNQLSPVYRNEILYLNIFGSPNIEIISNILDSFGIKVME